MRRFILVATFAVVAPAAAWNAASADPEPPIDCGATPAPPECAAAAPAAPVDPVAPPPAPPPPTDPPPTDAPTTTPPPSTVPPTTPTTVPGSDPAGSTTTTTAPAVTAPPTETTVPAPPVDTAQPPAMPPPAEDPAATTTTVPAPPEDIESAPVAPPSETEAGLVVVPAGAVDSGLLRPITFPVAGPIGYVNDWGACRDGCNRAHKGNDLIGDRLQPLLAMRDGVVDRLLDHPTAGRGIVIRDDEGWEYHLYHVNNDRPGTDDGADDGTWSVAQGITPGVRVTAGQLIGWMGDSGNSEGSVPHAHVEIHTPGGVAINPYWSLRRAQRDVNCAIGAQDPARELPADPSWLASNWSTAELPAEWRPLSLTGGHPGSGETAARMWVHPGGFTPVDVASLRVGDPQYDGGECPVPGTAELPPIPAEMAAILATIRSMESGGNYTVTITTSTASGAYGFLDSSWGGYGGYARAKDAPPEVQDAKAAEHAAAILARNGGDVSTIPVSWYIGHVPVGAEWDTIPRPDAGNRLTPREYQARWMARYLQLVATPDAWVMGTSTWTPVDVSATCRTVLVDVGAADEPQLLLTQAQLFFAESTGRAVLSPLDRCELSRKPPESEPVTEAIVEDPRTDQF